MNNFCSSIAAYQDPYIAFWLLLILIMSLCVFLIVKLFKKTKDILRRIIYTSIIFIVFTACLFVAVFSFILWGLIPLDDAWPSAGVAQMNAAIKNTCFQDPQQLNCPHTLSEVLRLYPEDFKKSEDKYVFTYEYRTDNTYTLVARPKNMGIYRSNVAIFDPRLKTATTSYKTSGLDFVDTKAYYCNGKYQLENPPPFPGPWDQIN